MTNYERGRAFEYRVAKDLRGMGYYVIRSPGSKSPADLIAIRKGAVLFVQCKTRGYMSVETWNELYDQAQRMGIVPLLASRTAHQREVHYWRLLGRKASGEPMPRGAYQPQYG